jgi:predicted secreted protein
VRGIEPEEAEAHGTAGAPIELPLRGGPATGYEWQLELPDGVARASNGPARPVEPGTRLGDAAGGALRVTATAGEHVLTARLARPWEPDAPIRVVRIRLHVAP